MMIYLSKEVLSFKYKKNRVLKHCYIIIIQKATALTLF